MDTSQRHDDSDHLPTPDSMILDEDPLDQKYSDHGAGGEDTDDLKLVDVEAQSFLPKVDSTYSGPTPSPSEYTVPTRVKLLSLFGYFSLNLTLTLYNKAILGGFNFPWLVTAVHCSTVSLGCWGLLMSRVFSLTTLSPRDNLVLIAFSFLFTINIAISNVSLALVSVPTHQVLRATGAAFMVLAYRVLYGRTYSLPTYLSLIPIIVGVGIATYGDYYYTLYGVLVTMLGVLLAVAKSMASNRIMTGTLKLSPYEVLIRMSPLAALQSVVYCWISGEARELSAFVKDGRLTSMLILAIAGNGLVAFALNISSFQSNKLAGALTMTVAGNFKQCMTILLGIALFHVRVGVLNGVGMVITVLGAAYYSKVELDAKVKGHAPPPQQAGYEALSHSVRQPPVQSPSKVPWLTPYEVPPPSSLLMSDLSQVSSEFAQTPTETSRAATPLPPPKITVTESQYSHLRY